MEKQYIAIDLKSFYASVECVDRGLDPLTANLVVADVSRTEKTICLAVSPALKTWGIPGRARLFEVIQKVREINQERRRRVPGGQLNGSSADAAELEREPSLALDYIAAPPRMARYMEVSTQIYNIYLKYIAPEDIHVYSIDEVFIDATPYLRTYKTDARRLARRMIQDVLEQTGITATAGIGTNLYLCKVALDIEAKHIEPDRYGVRIAELDELSYRQKLWSHRPLTDFWRIGPGHAAKLEENGLYTMGDVARCSVGPEGNWYSEELLYRLFGVNAELLIDHAWGWEPCAMAQIKAYKPASSSLGSGQVLQEPYSFEQAELVLREMADGLALDLAGRGLATDQLVLDVGYDIENLKDPERNRQYKGIVTRDPYGRRIPQKAHGSLNLGGHTSSARRLMEGAAALYERIADPKLLVRRLNLSANHVLSEAEVQQKDRQLDLFMEEEVEKQQAEAAEQEREKRLQQAVLSIKTKYGKNAVLRGMSLQEGATARERNGQIGGHKA